MAKTMSAGGAGKKDAYANSAYGYVLQTAINTLTFAQIMMGTGLFEGRALCLHRIKYFPLESGLRELVAATDALTLAITTTNRLTALSNISDPSIIDRVSRTCIAANIEPMDTPIISDFTMLPMGGRLIPANPLYLAINCGGFAAVCSCRAELEFTFVDMTSSDYLELLQSMYPANIS